MPDKIPVSTLVLVYTPDLRVLLIERADARGYWQSVTGSQEAGETLLATATRELYEETGIRAATDGGLARLADVERLRNLSALVAPLCARHDAQHGARVRAGSPRARSGPTRPARALAHLWLPWDEAATKCFSWSNRDAIRRLPQRAGSRGAGCQG